MDGFLKLLLNEDEPFCRTHVANVVILSSSFPFLCLCQIAGSTHNLGTSNRKVIQLPFDISSFKVLEKLQVKISSFALPSKGSRIINY